MPIIIDAKAAEEEGFVPLGEVIDEPKAGSKGIEIWFSVFPVREILGIKVRRKIHPYFFRGHKVRVDHIGLMIPSEPQIQGEIARNIPVVLDKEAKLGVVLFNLRGFRSHNGLPGDCICICFVIILGIAIEHLGGPVSQPLDVETGLKVVVLPGIENIVIEGISILKPILRSMGKSA